MNETMKNGETYARAWKDNMQGCTVAAKQQVAQCLKSKGSLDDLTSSLGKSTLATKAATVATKALSIAGNMITFMAIAKVIGFVVEKFDDYIHRAENAKETSDELFSSLESAKSTLSSHKDLIENVESNYQKLSSGVDEFGRNISLSNEEFETYQDTCNQIAEAYPSMVDAWDKEGNAVINLKNHVNDLKKAYDDERKSALNAFVTDANKVSDSYKLNANNSATFFGDTTGYNQKIAALEEYVKHINDANKLYELMRTGGEGFSGFDLQNALKDLDIKKYIDNTDGLVQYIKGAIGNLQTSLDTSTNDMRQSMLNMFELDTMDSDISDEAYQLGTSFINSLSSSFMDGKDTGELRSFTDNLINELNGENGDKVREAIENLVNIDENKLNLSTDEYIAYINNLISSLQIFLGMDENNIKLMIGMESNEDVSTYASRLVNSVKAKINETKSSPTAGILNSFGDLSKERKEIDDWVDSLSMDDLAIVNSDDFNKTLDEQKEKLNGATLSADDYNIALEKTKEAQNNLANSNSPIPFMEAIDSAEFADTKTKLLELAKSGELTATTLSSTEEYAKLLDATGLSADVAQSKILGMLNSTDKLSAASKGLNNLKSAYKDFEENGFVLAETLSSLPDVFKDLDDFDVFESIVGNPQNESKEIQQAFDDIVKQYLLSQETLTGLINASDGEVQSYIANLKSMSITNAEEIVNKTIDVINAENELLTNAGQEYFNIYSKYLTSKSEADLEYLNTANSYSSQLKNALGETYSSDYSNWTILLKEKAIAYNDFVNAIKGSQINIGNGSAAYSDEKKAEEEAKAIVKNKSLYGTKPDSPFSLLPLGLSDKNTKPNPNAEYTQEQVDKANNLLNSLKALSGMEETLKLDLSPINTDFGVSYTPKTSGTKSSGEKEDSEQKPFSEFFDWIEKRLGKLKIKTNELIEKVANAFSIKNKNKAISKALGGIRTEREANEKAYADYMSKAKNVDLTDEMKAKIDNGDFSTENITDEKLANKIKEYQGWTEKANEATDAVTRLKEEEKELMAQKLAGITDYYDAKKETKSAAVSYGESKIDYKNATGKKVTTRDYTHVIKNAESVEKIAKQEYKAYKSEVNKQINDGTLTGADKEAALAKIHKLGEACSEAAISVAELKNDQKAIKLVNLKSNLATLEGKEISIQSKISFRESRGYVPLTKYYTESNNNSRQQIKNLKDQNDVLKENMKTMDKGSEKWKECDKNIKANNDSIEKLTISMSENSKAASLLALKRRDQNLEKTASQNQLYDAKIDNTDDTITKNSYIDKKIDNINTDLGSYETASKKSHTKFRNSKKKINNYKSTKSNKTLLEQIQKYTNKTTGEKIPLALVNKAKKTDKKLFQYCLNYNDDMDADKKAKNDKEIFKETAPKAIANLELDKLNNIKTKYDYDIATNTQKKTVIDNQIAKAQAQGHTVDKSLYQNLIRNETDKTAILKNQKTDMETSFNKAVDDGTIKKYSPEWYEGLAAIDNVTNAIAESEIAVINYQKTMQKLDWDAFDKGVKVITGLNDETEYYIKLMANKKLVDEESGELTEYGTATLKLHESGYETEMKKAAQYANEYNKLKADIANGTVDGKDEDVINRLEELKNAERDATLAAEDHKQTMVDLVRQGYEAQLNSLQKTIEKYKELRNVAKEENDYQKSIAEKTKNISALQKQLAAYNQNSSEEAKSQIQKLQVSLKEAQDDLKDSEYEKYLSDSNDMLDKIYSDYEEFINEKLDNTDVLIEDVKKEISTSSTAVIETLKSLPGSISENLSKYLSTGTVPKYASGSRRISSNQMAITQDGGSEMIYSAADNSILMPLHQNDMVFTNEMTQRLWSLAKENVTPICTQFPLSSIAPPPASSSLSSSITIGEISMNGVNDPAEFALKLKDAIKHNKSVQKTLQSTTIDTLTKGHNSLSVMKY